jgi:hypothetical protein
VRDARERRESFAKSPDTQLEEARGQSAQVMFIRLSPFEVGITSRRQRAVTQLVRRLHGSPAGALSGGANGAGRSRTRGVGGQASGGVITRRKETSKRPLNTATTGAGARSRRPWAGRPSAGGSRRTNRSSGGSRRRRFGNRPLAFHPTSSQSFGSWATCSATGPSPPRSSTDTDSQPGFEPVNGSGHVFDNTLRRLQTSQRAIG